eukprot:1273527-Amphidinium_carterae.3
MAGRWLVQSSSIPPIQPGRCATYKKIAEVLAGHNPQPYSSQHAGDLLQLRDGRLREYARAGHWGPRIPPHILPRSVCHGAGQPSSHRTGKTELPKSCSGHQGRYRRLEFVAGNGCVIEKIVTCKGAVSHPKQTQATKKKQKGESFLIACCRKAWHNIEHTRARQGLLRKRWRQT